MPWSQGTEESVLEDSGLHGTPDAADGIGLKKTEVLCRAREEESGISPGSFRPRCEDDGSFSAYQCHGSTGYCWCSDKAGVTVTGTKGRPGPRQDDCEQVRRVEAYSNTTTCLLKKVAAYIMESQHDAIGIFTPSCQDDGSYAPLQCWPSTGECWCSKKSGEEINGTRCLQALATEQCADVAGGLPCGLLEVRCTVEHQKAGLNCIIGDCVSTADGVPPKLRLPRDEPA